MFALRVNFVSYDLKISWTMLYYINARETQKGQSTMDNPETLQHWVHKTQDEEKQS